jgi:fructoselysine-6-P-deglycase FrlB-like protein
VSNKNHTIEAKWAAHARDNVPARLAADKVLLLRKTFFAGAAAVLNIFDEISGRVSEDAATAIVEGLYEEAETEMKKEIN